MAAPTLGLATHPLNGDSLPWTCPLPNVAVPAAAAFNGSAASSPRPLVAPRVPMSWVAPPLASTDKAAAISPSPLSGSPVVGITPASVPKISFFPPRIWAAPPQRPAAPAVLPSQPPAPWPPTPPMPSIETTMATTPPEIFIGNVPLKHCSDPFISDDKIAAAFHNSSRKTLTYIPPSVQNGEVLVRSSIDMIREGSNRWNSIAVGYFLGKRPHFHHLNDFVRSIWPAVQDVKATTNGFFFFQFKTVAAMEEVLEGGPWLFKGQPIVLQRWEPGMVLRKHKRTQVPVWIRLRHLPVEFWTDDGLSTVASGVGRPLYQDTITRTSMRLDFARVCVMLDISSTLRKHLIIMMPKEDGNEVPCKVEVEVEYEWVPPKCKNCMSFGHATAACPESKKAEKPPVAVYVQKRILQPSVKQPLVTKQTVDEEVGGVEQEHRAANSKINDKGKEVVVYNPFDALMLVDDDSQPSRPSGGGASSRIQFIHCRITIRCAHLSVLATVVYGTNDTISRRGLWQKLVTLANSISDEPWIVGGDFNTVLDMNEGERFSWHNCSEGDRSLWKRLDRLIVNDAWLGQWPNSHYHCLNARTSDHSPLVIRGDTANHTVITRKLRALKPVFRSLRKKKGDLSVNVKLAAEFLGKVQHLLEGDRHNALLIRLEKCCKLVFLKATKLEQNMLQQKAKIQWLKGRDQCSRIFFRKVAMRYAAKRVFQIMNEDGRILTAHDEVVDEFVAFYQGQGARPGWLLISFYKAAWPVIGEEVVTAILEFFTTGRLLKQVNTTILALIPKVRVPSLVSDFRPISCCNVLYKVITKIVQHLRLVLDKIISPSQNAFVPGRSIGDNILLAQEMFSGYNRQGLPMRCALKVDLRKAYVTVEWDFLSAVLHLFGFSYIFIGWIEECVITPMFSVCINGNPHGSLRAPGG
ncbi:hypothetical protein Sango_3115800 [Sesamum angolense]|uniref:Reverse transcriptase domain-containing protein n=1 Tax=Sesamum angolense TaxID=2727404 RepID=A0AAE1VYV5_9LAMI|nr:hypothetical protein Sango_3115800 [Sesamum angolense]